MIFRILVTNTILFLFIYICINQFALDVYRIKNNSYVSATIKPVRICCLILTAPQYFDTRARAVNVTWGPRCDKYLFISESANNTYNLPIAPIKNLTAGYKYLTQKSTLAFYYTYENLIDQYDWFVKADDDTYLIVENLKSFLREQNSSEAISFGYNFKKVVKGGYHSGGAAYVLSREALRRFYQAHHEPNSTCLKDSTRGEDVIIGDCLRKKQVHLGNSLDKYNRERFHPFTFLSHFMGRFPGWAHVYAANKLLNGTDCCSDSTISFHYVSPSEQYVMDRMRYGFRSEN